MTGSFAPWRRVILWDSAVSPETSTRANEAGGWEEGDLEGERGGEGCRLSMMASSRSFTVRRVGGLGGDVGMHESSLVGSWKASSCSSSATSGRGVVRGVLGIVIGVAPLHLSSIWKCER